MRQSKIDGINAVLKMLHIMTMQWQNQLKILVLALTIYSPPWNWIYTAMPLNKTPEMVCFHGSITSNSKILYIGSQPKQTVV